MYTTSTDTNGTSTITTTPNNTNEVSSCGSRLPCGLCLITNRRCPMFPVKYEPICSTTTITNVSGEGIATPSAKYEPKLDARSITAVYGEENE